MTELKRKTLTTDMKNGHPIENMIGEVNVEIDHLNNRLLKLEKGPADPVTRSTTLEAGTLMPEFFVPVDRETGTVGCESILSFRRAAPRALERRDLRGGWEEVLPEYYVPVDRTRGTIGSDE